MAGFDQWQGAELFQPVLQRTACQVLHHHERFALGWGVAGPEKGDDVRMARGVPHGPALPIETPLGSFVGGTKHFDRHQTVHLGLEGCVGLGESAGSDQSIVGQPVYPEIDVIPRGEPLPLGHDVPPMWSRSAEALASPLITAGWFDRFATASKFLPPRSVSATASSPDGGVQTTLTTGGRPPRLGR